MHKYIRTHSCGIGRAGNAFIIPNHYNHSVAAFMRLLDEARLSFPDLNEEDTDCRTVIESRWVNRHPVLRFPCSPDTVKDGWKNVDELPDIQVS